MKELTTVQELMLNLIEHGSFNELDGERVANDLRNNLAVWKSAVFTRLVVPVYEKLENPFKRTTPPAPLLNRVNLIPLRDLPKNHANCDTLLIWAEPGQQDALEALSSTWQSSGATWHSSKDSAKAMGASRFEFKDYDDEARVILHLEWE